MKLLIYFLVMIISINGYSQKATTDSSQTCSQIANELSYYWKLDSLANNGFRLYTHKKFLDSKPGRMYADILITKLGKPNEKRKTNKGVEYIYYFFDIRTMPKHYKAPQACLYIAFKFESEENYLTSIEEGDIDVW